MVPARALGLRGAPTVLWASWPLAPGPEGGLVKGWEEEGVSWEAGPWATAPLPSCLMLPWAQTFKPKESRGGLVPQLPFSVK